MARPRKMLLVLVAAMAAIGGTDIGADFGDLVGGGMFPSAKAEVDRPVTPVKVNYSAKRTFGPDNGAFFRP